ncbi:MAG: hypothetical protein LV480_09730 [Methylacidiphilales bacterium]|nr:hypothetical protein [Candidatus Methylacidiphilales bacterium]
MHGVSIAWRCLVLAAPFVSIAALWWLINRTDQVIHYLFPHLEWEKSLGWLNIRAERRAKTALRWIGHAIYALLAVALYGIVWAAEGLRQLDHWSDPWVVGDLALRVPVLAICLGAWVLYLGGWLMPKLRAEREEAELKKFREEMEEAEKEREMQSHSRFHSPLPKPRTNPPLLPREIDRSRRRR